MKSSDSSQRAGSARNSNSTQAASVAPRLAIVGASGRMGREIAGLAADTNKFKLSLAIARKPVDGFSRVASKLDLKAASEIDVVIDFSLPEATPSVAKWCAENRKPLVSGVTGLSESDHDLLRAASSDVAVLWAPNMSLGIAAMAEMLKAFSNLDGFEFQIEELHHIHKKDRPSGTALFLQKALKSALALKGNKVSLPEPIAIRGGGVFGIHKAWAFGAEETLSIEHVALNRRVFARGALSAAKWIASAPPGLYTMADLL